MDIQLDLLQGMSRFEREFVGLGVALAAIVLIGLGYPMFLGLTYVNSDLANFYLPIRDFYHSCLANGDSFIWWPKQLNGFYLHGEGQAGLYHPLNLALYSLGDLTLAFNLEFLRSYLLLLPGMFVLLRRLRLPADAAIFGAILFTFSSFNLLHHMHLNMTAGIAHFPWLLVAIHIAVRDGSRRRVAIATCAVVLLTASQLLLAHLQVVWMSLLLEAYFALALLHAQTGRRWIGRAARLVAAKFLGALCASIQVLPVWVTLWGSFRAAPTEKFLSTLPLEPLDLLQLVSPYLVRFGHTDWEMAELGLYCGAVVPVLLVWLLLRLRFLGSLRVPAILALYAGVLSLVLALGGQGGLYQLQKMLPVAGLFRAPARYVLLFQFAAAIAAAIAFVDLRRVAESATRQSWRLLWPLTIPFFLSLGFAIAVWAMDLRIQARVAAPEYIAVGAAICFIATGLVIGAALGVRGMLMAILVFAVADLGAYGLSFVWLDEPKNVIARSAEMLEADGNPEAQRSPKRRILQGHPTIALAGVFQAGGYVAMTPNRKLLQPRIQGRKLRHQFIEFLRGDLATRNAVLRVASVAWEYKRAIPDPLPRARLVSRVQLSANPLADITSIDVDRTVLVDEPIELPGGPAGSARITNDRPGEIWIATDAGTRQILILSESYHTGWRVEIDGEAGRVIRAYGDFMGVVINAGSHSIRFLFDAPSLRLGKALTTFGFAMLLLWLVVEAALHRRIGTKVRTFDLV